MAETTKTKTKKPFPSIEQMDAIAAKLSKDTGRVVTYGQVQTAIELKEIDPKAILKELNLL